MNNQPYPEQDQTTNKSSQNDQESPNNLMEKGEGIIKNFKNEAKNKFEKTVDQVKDKSSETQAALSNYIKAHSLLSLGCSILAGVIIGAMLRK